MFRRPPEYCKALRVIRTGMDAIGQNRIIVVDYICDYQKGQLRPMSTTFVSSAKTAEEKAKERVRQIQEATGMDPIEQNRVIADYFRDYQKRQRRPRSTANVGSTMTDEERRAANAQRMRVFRQMQRAAEVTPEEASAHRAAEADRVRRHRQKRRAEETPEEASARRAANAARARRSRQKLPAEETPEEASARRAAEAERVRRHRQKRHAEETPEEASARRAANAARMRLQRQKRLAKGTPEEASQNGNLLNISGQLSTTTAHTNPSPSLAPDRHRLSSQNGSDELRSCGGDDCCVNDGTPSVCHTVAQPVEQPLMFVHSIADVFLGRQHPCDFCGDEFSSLSDLEMHQKSEHPDWAAGSFAT